MQEKKRREQLEHEMEDVIEAINKVKLKLREFK
jgi:formiminotetrahydrofolate cyclodeaminase